MTKFETAIPRLKEIQSKTEEEIGKLGPIEPGWSSSGMSVDAALATGKGNPVQHVLGEWEVGGHGVITSGDVPLPVPEGFQRYVVREYRGTAAYHGYHRLAGGIVLHTFGSAIQTGNAQCQHSQGIELISQEPWQGWSPKVTLAAFGTTRAARDDTRVYCILYRPTDDGGFLQVAYTREGQPYVVTNEDPQAFTVTTRAVAAERLFGP